VVTMAIMNRRRRGRPHPLAWLGMGSALIAAEAKAAWTTPGWTRERPSRAARPGMLITSDDDSATSSRPTAGAIGNHQARNRHPPAADPSRGRYR